jgi:hypothetical protein
MRPRNVAIAGILLVIALIAGLALRPQTLPITYLVISADEDISIHGISFDGIEHRPYPWGAREQLVLVVPGMRTGSLSPTLKVTWIRDGQQRSIEETIERHGEARFCVVLLQVGSDGELQAPRTAGRTGQLLQRTCGYGP